LSAVILIASVSLPVFAQKSNSAEESTAVKATVAKIGTGPEALVQVKRRDKTKVKGFIKEAREEDFDVISTQKGTRGMTVTIPYSDVVKIKGKGIDWTAAGAKASFFGLKALKVMVIVLKGACLGPISRCSP